MSFFSTARASRNSTSGRSASGTSASTRTFESEPFSSASFREGHDVPHTAPHHLGDEPALTGDHRHSTVHRLGRVSTTGGFDLPGEFDLPPEEPVVLIGRIPWELRDPDDFES
ncbi:hypothetical protein [uncultured Amnibacterium sp.]|uniref:hypothetical protein n=1 Tax=uncultured Amnibacterium sp. TaxID=1631851 RepID=UPI0035CCA13E